MWPIKTSLFFFGFITACAFSLVYPMVGIANYMMIYLVNPRKMWWGKPLETLGIRYSMTAAICLILGMIISSTRVPRLRSFLGGWEALLVLFTIVVLMSPAIGIGTSSYGILLMDKTVKMTIFVICLTRMASTRKNFMMVLWVLVVGALVIGRDAYNAPDSDFFGGRLNFVGGPDFRESSGLAAHMSAMLPLIGVAFMVAASWRWRFLALVAGVLSVNTIVQCRTRSAFIGILAGVIVGVLLAPRRRRMRVYAGLIVACLGAYALTDDFFVNRMNTVFQPDKYNEDDTIRGRLALWGVGFEMFTDYPFGVGVGRFRDVMGNYRLDYGVEFGTPRRVTHNSYILCATELGLQGLIVFSAIVGLSLYKSLRCARLAGRTADPPQGRFLSYGCSVSIVIYAVSALFTDRLYTESYWWVMALPICLERAMLREVTAHELVPELLEKAHERYETIEPYPAPPAGGACGALG